MELPRHFPLSTSACIPAGGGTQASLGRGCLVFLSLRATSPPLLHDWLGAERIKHLKEPLLAEMARRKLIKYFSHSASHFSLIMR